MTNYTLILYICDTLNVYRDVLAVDAFPCRMAFERGKEREFCFLVVSNEISGWIIFLMKNYLDAHQDGIVLMYRLHKWTRCTD